MSKNPKPALYTVALCTHSDRDSDHDSYSEPLEWSLSRIASRASKIPYTGAATESISRWCRPASVPQPAREWGSGPGPPCPTARAGGGSASPCDPDPGRGPARRQGLQVAESLRLAGRRLLDSRKPAGTVTATRHLGQRRWSHTRASIITIGKKAGILRQGEVEGGQEGSA